uniref:Uncharacterized protein n=3 Tax=Timema TaxID=61471 RepID=A0A7R8Z736_TIMDO|nr:unnamed protein product [Timema douglasi]
MDQEGQINQWLLDDSDEDLNISLDEDDSDDSDIEQPANSEHDCDSEVSGDDIGQDQTKSSGPHYVGRDNVTLWNVHPPRPSRRRRQRNIAYYRQGVALQCLGRHSDALAAFSSGLAQDPKSIQLLAGLVEASMKSPLRITLEPTFHQLEAMKLDKSPFVIISVVGQELLGIGQYAAAVIVLEAALHIGTCSLKLRGSVFSALSSAYWALNSLDKVVIANS